MQEFCFSRKNQAIISISVSLPVFYVMIEIFDDRVEISNPGGLPKALDQKDFGKKSIRRNPLIANLFQRARFIEKLGTDINRMKKEGILNRIGPDKGGYWKKTQIEDYLIEFKDDINRFLLILHQKSNHLNIVYSMPEKLN